MKIGPNSPRELCAEDSRPPTAGTANRAPTRSKPAPVRKQPAAISPEQLEERRRAIGEKNAAALREAAKNPATCGDWEFAGGQWRCLDFDPLSDGADGVDFAKAGYTDPDSAVPADRSWLTVSIASANSSTEATRRWRFIACVTIEGSIFTMYLPGLPDLLRLAPELAALKRLLDEQDADCCPSDFVTRGMA